MVLALTAFMYSRGFALFFQRTAFVLSVGLAFGGFRSIWTGMRRKHFEASTSPQGLSITQGDQTEFVAWKEIAFVFEERASANADRAKKKISAIGGGNGHLFRIGTFDGRILVLNAHLDDLEGLGVVLRIATLKHLLPPAFEALENSETLEFNQVSCNLKELSIRDTTFDWADVAEITVDGGMMNVRISGGKTFTTYRQSLFEIPNAHVFLDIASIIRPSALRQQVSCLAESFSGDATQSRSIISRPTRILVIVFLMFVGGLFTMVGAFGAKGPPNDMLTLVIIGSVSLLLVGFGMAVREFRTMK